MTNFKSCCCRNFFFSGNVSARKFADFFSRQVSVRVRFFRFPKSVRISDRSSLGGKVELNCSSLTPASHLKKCWQCQDVESEVHFLVTRSYTRIVTFFKRFHHLGRGSFINWARVTSPTCKVNVQSTNTFHSCIDLCLQTPRGRVFQQRSHSEYLNWSFFTIIVKGVYLFIP